MEDVTLEKCIRAFNSSGALIITFECYESIQRAPKGKIPIPKENEKKLGEHAVAIFDHSPEEQCFYFKNSWGGDWGDKGYGTLPYDYIEKGYVKKITTLA